MKNIHIISTDKPSRLYKTGNFLLLDSKSMPNNTLETINQNIYITSDGEIKDGDWFLPKGHITPHKLKGFNKINGVLESYNGLCYDISKCKKIILTTDQDLISNGIEQISEDVLLKIVEHVNSGKNIESFDECYAKPKQEQDKKMYSEEEVYNIVEQAIKNYDKNQLGFSDGGFSDGGVSNPIYYNLKRNSMKYTKVRDFLMGTSFGVCLVCLDEPNYIYPLIIGGLAFVSFIINLNEN